MSGPVSRTAGRREPQVTVALGGALMMQAVAGLVWAGAAAERLEQLEHRVDASEELRVRTARLEEQSAHIRATVVRIEDKIDARGPR